MSVEENKAAKKRYFETFNERDIPFEELFAEDYVAHVPGFPEVRGRTALQQLVEGSLVSLPDAKLTIDDMLAEGDNLVSRWLYEIEDKQAAPSRIRHLYPQWIEDWVFCPAGST